MSSGNYLIREYPLQQGALEIAYIEEYFREWPDPKTGSEILQRLEGRECQILMAEAALPDDPSTVVPVSYKVSHELRAEEADPKLVDLVARLRDTIDFDEQKVLYNWLGATRMDWRGQGHFRALTEEQEVWAVTQGYGEVVVKTKNRYFDMRGTLDSLQFNVVKLEPAADPLESKVYLSKRLGPFVLDAHRSTAPGDSRVVSRPPSSGCRRAHPDLSRVAADGLGAGPRHSDPRALDCGDAGHHLARPGTRRRIGPPEEAIEAARRFGSSPGDHRYGPIEGIPALVERARREARP